MSKSSSRRDLPPPPLPFTGAKSKAENQAKAPKKSPLQGLTPPLEARGLAGRYSILAQRRDGVTYHGDIIKDTIEYRGLRAASMRSALQPRLATRLAELEEQLRQAPAPTQPSQDETLAAAALRSFQRYNCCYLAAVHYSEPSDPQTILCMPAQVADISAGGVKISGVHDFEPGLPVVLHIRDTGPDCMETQLPSRIAWTAGDAFGLMFAGPPKLVRHLQTQEQAA